MAAACAIALMAMAGAVAESQPPSLAVVTEVEPASDLPPCCTAPGRFAHLAAASLNSNRVSLEPSDRGTSVLVDGKLFTEYRTDTPHQPAIWPIIGPSGHEMTRSFPLGPESPAERKDHPHHESLWFSHGGVNGYDFWHVGEHSDSDQPAHIAHRETISTESSTPLSAVMTTLNDWTAGGEVQMTDRRTVTFGVLPSDSGTETGAEARYVDFTIVLQASHGPVTFADTKEGTFGVRVPGPMKTDAGFGSQTFNSAGDRGASAWGQPASWVAYQGPLAIPVDGEAPQGGIAIMSHPDGFNPKCRWHVRGYGLFAANPFGVTDFPNDGTETGGHHLTNGETLTLRYRVVFLAERVDAEVIESWYERFAATSLLTYTANATVP